MRHGGRLRAGPCDRPLATASSRSRTIATTSCSVLSPTSSNSARVPSDSANFSGGLMRDLVGRHQALPQRFVKFDVPAFSECFLAATPRRLVQLEFDLPSVGLNHAAAVFVSKKSSTGCS